MGKADADKHVSKEDVSLVSSFIEEPVCTEKRSRNLKRMDAARAYTLETLGAYGAEAVQTLVSLMHDSEKDDIRLRAAMRLLEYNVGKPTEAKMQDNSKTISLSDDEFEEIITDGEEEKLQKIIEDRYGRNSKR